MTQNISARRGAAIAGFASLVLLALLAAFDNQWLDKWRAGRSADGGSAAHSWFAGPVRGLSAPAWRATKQAGEPTRVFVGVLAEPVITVVLTFLLLLLVCRGVGAERGRWALFLGSWFVTGLAAAAALIAGSGIAGTAVAAGTTNGEGTNLFGRGDVTYTLIAFGLAFGLFAGWLVGFAAVLVYGSTETAEDERTTQEYETPSYIDYGPTSPYSSGHSSSPYSSEPSSSYESETATTKITTPPHESNPYGGGRPY